MITQKRKRRTEKDGIPSFFSLSFFLGNVVFLLSPLFPRAVKGHFSSLPLIGQTSNGPGQTSPLLSKPPDIEDTRNPSHGQLGSCLINSHLKSHPFELSLSADINTPNQSSFMPSLLTLEPKNQPLAQLTALGH